MPANPMLDQIRATPAALEAGFDALERSARLVLSTPLLYRTRRIVLTGSGDSRFAAKAAEFAFLAHAGLPVEVRPPLEAGRYHAGLSAARDLENTLVIALSNSGAAARVCEAAALYRRRGAHVLAVTRNPQGRLAGLAQDVLVTEIPDLPAAPGFGPYQFAMSALFLLAIRIGEVRMGMTMDVAQGLRSTLRGSYATLAQTIAAAETPVRALADDLAPCTLLEFLGGGPSAAVADYGAAKILEATGRHALSADLEEWAHLNYFDGDPEAIGSVLILPSGGRSASRGTEVRAFMTRLGRRIGVIGDGLPAGAGIDELWSPICTSAPVAMLAAVLAERDGAEYGRGAKGRWSDAADASTVQKSALFEDLT